MSAAAQPDFSGSCMIALYPPPDATGRLAIDGGLPPGDMHLTIAYTGDAADVDPQALAAVAQSLSARPPVQGTVSGHARFTGGKDGDVIVALVDSPALESLRADAMAALAAAGIAVPSEHGFTPHMTICYQDPDAADQVGRVAAFPVTFGDIAAVHGKQQTVHPFAGPAGPGLDDAAAQGLREQAIWNQLAGVR